MLQNVCAVACTLLTLCAGLALEKREALEYDLLSQLGINERPKHHNGPPPKVPLALQQLYARGALPGDANTARPYYPIPSSNSQFPGHHLYFNISNVPTGETLVGAEIFFQRDPKGTTEQRLRVYMVRTNKATTGLQLVRAKPLRTAVNPVRVNVKAAVQLWLEDPEHNKGLIVRVEDFQSNKTAEDPRVRLHKLETETDAEWHELQPVLLVFTQQNLGDDKQKQDQGDRIPIRTKRAMDSSEYSQSLCSRKPLYVDFSDLNWDDFVVAPPGYYADYCDGDCDFPMRKEHKASLHAIMQSSVNAKYPMRAPKPCCVPTKLSDISVITYDNQDNVIVRRRNMKVKECGCR